MNSDKVLEARSFDFVPKSERYGNVRSQIQLWFMVNATVITLYTGAVGPGYGLGFAWTVTAIVLGSVCGTIFQAFHGAQGPQMGLPQMIQSRVQFGSRGAVLPLVAAMLSQFGFAVFLLQTGAQSLSDVGGGSAVTPLQIGLGVVAAVVAIIGHRLLMRIEKAASYITLAMLLLVTLAAFLYLPPLSSTQGQAFSLVPFLAQFGASAIYQLAIAPIISDYTRYLPSKISGAAVSAAVFGGTMLSAVWLETLGAALSIAFPGADVIASLHELGNSFGLGLGTATMIVAAGACLITTAITFYSGSVALLSAAEAFTPFNSTAAVRSATIVVSAVVVVGVTLSLSSDILTTFAGFLSLLGYFLIPWTAVNLTDYYYVRKGKFSISDIMRPDGGIYGYWGKAGIISYMIGFVSMIPFFSSPIYVGPIAAALDKADLSFVVGLLVSTAAYLLLTRRYDLEAEVAYIRTAPLNTLD